MNGWAIAGIVVGIVVLLVLIGWVRHVVGNKRFDKQWEKMSEDEQKEWQKGAYRAVASR